MEFISIRIITANVARLAEFYEKATGLTAAWPTDDFAELRTSRATIALSGTRPIEMFTPGATTAADNRSVILEFLVDDVDQVFANLTDLVTDVVKRPTTMPWGNRSLLVRDPDGNLVNFFTPVTPAAKEKFGH